MLSLSLSLRAVVEGAEVKWAGPGVDLVEKLLLSKKKVAGCSMRCLQAVLGLST